MKTPYVALRRRLVRATVDDSGFTLIELVVVLLIMTIVMIIFTAGISQAFSAENKEDTATRGQNQLIVAFQRLDKEVRYAAGITTPATVNNPNTGAVDPVVEWLTTNTGTSVCTEVRLNTGTGQLQQRSWTYGLTPFVPGAWQQLADGITVTAPATTPFTVYQSGSVVNATTTATTQYQRLEIAVTATYGVNSNKTSTSSDITFTALNTTSSTTNQTAVACAQGQGVSW